MKKVLSFVLVLCMILGSFGMAFAAPADVVGTDYEDAVTALTELGVVAGYKDGSFKPANIVTRAEMATFLIKALGLNDYAVGKSAFTDMAGHWADPYVAYAADLGFVKGNTDGTFAPDVTVSYDQAITMVVQALGYKAEYLIGSYPGAFVNKAKALGILDGIKSGVAGANRGDIAVLLYNSLDKAIVRYTEEGETVNEGTMRGRLTGTTGAAREKYVITGAEDAVINPMNYQGAYVDYFVNDDGDIAAIKEVKSVFLTGTVNKTASTSALLSDNTVKFVVDDVEYTAASTANKVVNLNVTGTPTASGIDVNFVNGRTSLSAIDTLTKDTEYVIAAKVSGKTIKEIYSISTWDAGTTIQWDVDVNVEDLEDDLEINGDKFEDDDSFEIDTTKFALVGVDSLDEIKDKDVVTYYVGGGYITKVEVCRDVVEGKITEVQTEKVVINGKAYKETLTEAPGVGKLALGAEGKFYLNAAGKIAYADTTTVADDYAIVLVANDNTTAYGEDDVMKIKLLTATGDKTIFVMDADMVKNESIATNAFISGTAVKYNVAAKDGEINVITSAGLTSESGMVYTAKGYLAGIKVAENVVVFEKALDGSYSVGSIADVPVNKSLAGTQFATNGEGEIALIVLDANNKTGEDGVYGVVVSAGNVEDAAGDTVAKVVMLVDGKEATYYGDSSFKKSDVDAVTTDAIDSLFKLQFKGSDLTGLTTIAAVTGAAASDNATVAAIENGNLKIGTKYFEVANDAVVYELTEDGFVASAFKNISKKDQVVLFQVDTDDKNGADIVIFKDL